MTPAPFASTEEMEKHLLKKKWKKVKGGWFNKDEKEFGKAIYSTVHAYRIQLAVDYDK